MDVDDPPRPRMKTVRNFALLGPVGVLKLRSTIAAARIRALTARRPIKPTSIRCHSAWQPNPAEAPLSDAENLVQTSGTTSVRVGDLCANNLDHLVQFRNLSFMVNNSFMIGRVLQGAEVERLMKIIGKTANRSASQAVRFSPSSSSIVVIVIGLRRDRLRW
jgi:hypothetical protein